MNASMDINALVARAPAFMVVFIRMSAFMLFVPFFGNRNFIMPVKMGFAFLVSLLLFPVLPGVGVAMVGTAGFVLVAIQEMLVGVLMGLTLLIMLFALQLAGRLVGFQMAFSLSNVVDPATGTDSNILGAFLVLLGTLLLLNLGGDHYLLFALRQSFDMLPPGQMAVGQQLNTALSDLVMRSFELGFRLAAPAVILLLAIDVTMGLIGKTAAKMQIFFVGLPLKIAVGLFGISLMLTFILAVWGKEVARLPEYLTELFRWMGTA